MAFCIRIVDFGNGGFTEFWTSYCLTNQYGGKIVQWRLDSLFDGPIIGEIKVTASGSWSEFLDQKNYDVEYRSDARCA